MEKGETCASKMGSCFESPPFGIIANAESDNPKFMERLKVYESGLSSLKEFHFR